MSDVRVGLGIDLHARAGARRLYLGGELFEGEDGLAGHSDGDVVCHAVADAMLGAAGLGDLGEHFPDTDPAFEEIAGLDLLGRVVAMVAASGLVPAHCDLTVLAERPSVAPRRAAIRANLARVLGVREERVSVKATRPEGLGLTGDGAGCLAVVTLEERPANSAPDAT
jgi:2-C-methyl-D-erythritol 2,4-cyclodiphosphate synthase